MQMLKQKAGKRSRNKGSARQKIKFTKCYFLPQSITLTLAVHTFQIGSCQLGPCAQNGTCFLLPAPISTYIHARLDMSLSIPEFCARMVHTIQHNFTFAVWKQQCTQNMYTQGTVMLHETSTFIYILLVKKPSQIIRIQNTYEVGQRSITLGNCPILNAFTDLELMNETQSQYNTNLT